MTILGAAERVLREAGRPMHSKEIIEYAKEKRWIAPRGKTPDHTLQAAVFKHIRAHGRAAIFARVGKGKVHRRYALRDPSWKRIAG
jgi:hypothetical protein